MIYQVYCDGSTRGNGYEGSVGGYGYIVVNSQSKEIIERFVARETEATNQRCEMLAILSACQYVEKQNIDNFIIYTDSAYCFNAWKDKWYIRWEKGNKWLTSKGEPVKNQDLWKRLLPYYKNLNYHFEKVKGHDTNYYNNFIDSLVTTISRTDINYIQGEIFGELECLGLWGNKFTDGATSLLWKCRCSCGKVFPVSVNNLVNGQKSCGCLAENRSTDLTSQVFGFLKPIKKVGKTLDNYALWECSCLNCGGLTQVSSRALKEQISCGCIKSKGEAKISQLLSNIGIKYKKEVKFDALKDEESLRFDFGIYNELEQLIALIEFQGRQHFVSNNSGWNNEAHLEKTQKHDNMKRKFCEQNNIKLIEIPYYDFEKINEEYIKEVIYNEDSHD